MCHASTFISSFSFLFQDSHAFKPAIKMLIEMQYLNYLKIILKMWYTLFSLISDVQILAITYFFN